LERCAACDAQEREQFYINLLKPTYNVRKVADSNRGVVRSEEQKKYLSNLYKGKKRSQESIDKQKISIKDYVKTDEHLAKIRLANLGKKRSEQYRLNRSYPVIVVDTLTNTEIEFESISKVATHFNTANSFICVKIKQSKLIRGQYLINRKIETNVHSKIA
jgi:group I intron endonuclease